MRVDKGARAGQKKSVVHWWSLVLVRGGGRGGLWEDHCRRCVYLSQLIPVLAACGLAGSCWLRGAFIELCFWVSTAWIPAPEQTQPREVPRNQQKPSSGICPGPSTAPVTLPTLYITSSYWHVWVGIIFVSEWRNPSPEKLSDLSKATEPDVNHDLSTPGLNNFCYISISQMFSAQDIGSGSYFFCFLRKGNFVAVNTRKVTYSC